MLCKERSKSLIRLAGAPCKDDKHSRTWKPNAMWLASSDLENSLEVTFEADKVVLPERQDHII